MIFWDQHGFNVRLDWGVEGARRLASVCPVIVVVDVLRFTTVVDIAVSGGVAVEPLSQPELGADPISPSEAERAAAGSRIRIHSPNGGAVSITAAAAGAEVVAACFRNVSSTAAAMAGAGPVGLMAAGERWPDESLRPCWEDLCGAGSIAAAMPSARLSPEAEAAASMFLAARSRLPELLKDCVSGRELLERGLDRDIALAAALDVGTTVAIHVAGAFSERQREPLSANGQSLRPSSVGDGQART